MDPEFEMDSSDFPGLSELRPAWTGREKWSARRNEVAAYGAKRALGKAPTSAKCQEETMPIRLLTFYRQKHLLLIGRDLAGLLALRCGSAPASIPAGQIASDPAGASRRSA
jgi:hypothetical protein